MDGRTVAHEGGWFATAGDLTIEWSADRRQRWVLDVDQRASDDEAKRPSLPRRTDATLRASRLPAERDACGVAPYAADSNTWQSDRPWGVISAGWRLGSLPIGGERASFLELAPKLL